MASLYYTTSIDSHKCIGEVSGLTSHETALYAASDAAQAFNGMFDWPVIVNVYAPGMTLFGRYQVKPALTATELEPA